MKISKFFDEAELKLKNNQNNFKNEPTQIQSFK